MSVRLTLVRASAVTSLRELLLGLQRMPAVRTMFLIVAAVHIVSWCCSVHLEWQTDMGGGVRVLLRAKLPVLERLVMLQMALKIDVSLVLILIYSGLLFLL
jgi:hypothetical protein